METPPPDPDSFRKLIHDLNQTLFLMRGHCELARNTGLKPEEFDHHIRQMETFLDHLTDLAKEFKIKQLELAPEE